MLLKLKEWNHLNNYLFESIIVAAKIKRMKSLKIIIYLNPLLLLLKLKQLNHLNYLFEYIIVAVKIKRMKSLK